MLRWVFAILLLATPAHAQNTLFSATPGDMIYRGASTWQPVPSGLAGQVLMSNGAAAAPTWTYGWGTYTTAPIVLPQIATNRALMNVTGSNAAPTPGTASQFLDTIGYDTLRPPGTGAMLYKDGTTGTWQATTGGANAGAVMTMQSNGVAAWLAPTGGVYIATGALGTCLVSTGTTTAPAYSSCLSATSLSATLPLTASFGAVQATIACPTCATDSDIRTRLTTNTTYNVPADFATFCAATDYLSDNVDGASNNVTIQIADGSYNSPICYIRPFVGVDALNIQGNCSSLTAVTLKSSSGGSIAQFQQPNNTVTTFTCIQFDPNGSVPAVGIYHGNVVTFDRTTWVASGGTGNLAVATTGGTNINFNTSVTVGDLGTSSSFAFSGDNGFLSIEPSTTVTISGTPTYTYFFSATRGGVINAGSGVTYVNGAGATGLRYALFSGAVLDVNGATGALPGSSEFNDGSSTYINPAGKTIVPLPVSAVSDLPTCDGNIVGAKYLVVDNNTALSFGDVISTGGSIVIPVFCNGSAWRQG